jgi:hypothetical protein
MSLTSAKTPRKASKPAPDRLSKSSKILKNVPGRFQQIVDCLRVPSFTNRGPRPIWRHRANVGVDTERYLAADPGASNGSVPILFCSFIAIWDHLCSHTMSPEIPSVNHMLLDLFFRIFRNTVFPEVFFYERPIFTAENISSGNAV